MKTPLEVVGAPPEALAANDLWKVRIGRSRKGVKLLGELMIGLVLILLGLLLAITRSRGRFAPFLGILGLGVLVLLGKLVEALPNSLDLSLESHDLSVVVGRLVSIILLDAVHTSA